MGNHSSKTGMDTETREKDGRNEEAGAGAVEEQIMMGSGKDS